MTQDLLHVDALHLALPDLARNAPFRRRPLIHILHGVDFRIRRGEAVGIVGESGSGKTTLGRAMVRLLEPTGGRITFDGQDITHAPEPALRPLRARMTMIFQNPLSSLNPRHSIAACVAAPLRARGLRGDLRGKVLRALDRAGLPARFADRYPHQLSGGQRQRAGIARAIITEPEFILADEIVSGLDVSTQAQILDLLRELQRDMGLALAFIAHDLSVVRVLCERVVVMHRGRIVEEGPCAGVFAAPQDPYTRRLLSAIPLPDLDDGWLDADAEDLPDPVPNPEPVDPSRQRTIVAR
jgi:ABC-type oligopeptide transport system ATPase subunit